MHSLTDDGNAQRLIEAYGNKLRWCPQLGWLAWNGHSWARSPERALALARRTARDIKFEAYTPDSIANHNKDKDAPLAELDHAKPILKWAQTSLAATRIEAMLRLAKSEKSILVQAQDLDPDPMLFATKGGVVNLATTEIMRPDPNLLTSCHSPVKPDYSASCPKWLRFINDITNNDDDMALTLQTAVGYSLTGLISEQCFFILFGVGANGKSTFLSVIRTLMGSYGTHIGADTVLAKRYGGGATNDIAALHNKRFVCMTESEQSAMLNEARVKAMTGEASISARFLYQEHFEFKVRFKLFLGTNHKPRVRDANEAIWRRIRLLPFSVQIPRDRWIKDLDHELIATELPGIFNWALQGCSHWLQNRELHTAEVVTVASEEYRSQEDTIGQFIDDCIIAASTGYVDKSDLYKVYIKWAAANGLQSMSKKRLGAELLERGWHEQRTKKARFWMEVELTPDAEQARVTGLQIPFGV